MLRKWCWMMFICCYICSIHTENWPDCPDGWVRFKESCYFFADEHGFDWTEATHFCASNFQSHLVVVDSHEEDQLLINFAHRLFKDLTHNPKFWLGANDAEIEGIYVWYTDHKHVTDGYQHWAPGEPAGSNAIEDCMCLHPPYFLWHDCICTEKNHPLCEKNMTEEHQTDIIG